MDVVAARDGRGRKSFGVPGVSRGKKLMGEESQVFIEGRGVKRKLGSNTLRFDISSDTQERGKRRKQSARNPPIFFVRLAPADLRSSKLAHSSFRTKFSL